MEAQSQKGVYSLATSPAELTMSIAVTDCKWWSQRLRMLE